MEQLSAEVFDGLNSNGPGDDYMLDIGRLFIVKPPVLRLHADQSHQFIRLLRHDNDCLGQDTKRCDVAQVRNRGDLAVPDGDQSNHNEVEGLVESKRTVVIEVDIPVIRPVRIQIYRLQTLTVFNLLESSSTEDDDEDKNDENNIFLPIDVGLAQLVLVVAQEHRGQERNSEVPRDGN